MKRHAWLSFLLSLLRPGLGLFYNGQLIKGLIIDCSYMLLNNVLLVLIAIYSCNRVVNVLSIFIIFISYLVLAVYSAKTSIDIGTTFVPGKLNKWYYYIVYFICLTCIVNYPLNRFVIKYFANAYRLPTPVMEGTILRGDFIIADHTVFKAKKEPGLNDVIIFKYFGVKQKDYIKRIIGCSGQKIRIIKTDIFVNDEKIDNPPFSKHIRHGFNPQFQDAYEVTVPSPNDIIPVAELNLRDFMYLYHLVKQENSNVAAEVHVYNGGELQNTKSLSDFDNWLQLKRHLVKTIPSLGECKINNYLTVNGEVIERYQVKYRNYFVMGDNRDNSFDSRYYGYVNDKSIKGKAKVVYWSVDNGVPFYDIIHWIRWNRIGKTIQ